MTILRSSAPPAQAKPQISNLDAKTLLEIASVIARRQQARRAQRSVSLRLKGGVS